MKNRIENAYCFTKDELELVKNNFNIHDDWDKYIFSSIKGNIRDVLRIEQDNKCCYCKKELGYDIKEVDIEHIIPKATYPDFTFIPRNLALSCPSCNTTKGDKPVLSKKILKHPNNSNYHTIVHAHYDDYSKHISINDGCIFEALSTKGSNTITVCKLFRLKVVEKKAKRKIVARSKEGELVEMIRTASLEELKDAMDELLKRIK